MKRPTSPKSEVRCVGYTRKSTTEGLDQDFNSLDAQRESIECYIASMKSEGWVCLPDRYDDGGFSGGSMERPALKRLLEDSAAGKFQAVVVNRVDRISRSILDFVRIMETFEKYGVAFVSTTQQFNTSSSMGRLVLNILLSFAQFEREMIAERTRDKMSAARRRGKWTGGLPVLGYDVDPRGGRLVVNLEEAQQVREIFQLYLKKGSILRVARALNRRGWRNKSWVTRDGRHHQGQVFTKKTLQRLLNNVTYLGKVRFRGELYEGEHEAVVDTKLWERVQRQLASNRIQAKPREEVPHPALLRGLLVCGGGDCPMYLTYTSKRGKVQYPYYVCSQAEKLGCACPTKRLPAQEIEDFVLSQVRQVTLDSELVEKVFEKIGETGKVDIGTRAKVKKSHREQEATPFGPLWETLNQSQRAQVLGLLLERIEFNGQEGAVAFHYKDTGIRISAGETTCK